MNHKFLPIWLERSTPIDHLLNCADFLKKKNYQKVIVISLPLIHAPTAYFIGMPLIDCLIDALMRWTIGSELTTIPIENKMHDMIALGVGFLAEMPSTLEDGVNVPVYISEPLVVLSLRSIFETQRWMTMKVQMTRSFRNALNPSELGYVLEMALPLVIMETFGGKFNPLEEAFIFKPGSSLGSRRVTLVSLKRIASGEMQICPVSWNKGSSDRFGLKAKTPAHVLEFFKNPDGKIFLFPDNYMHPDLSWFFQDEETKELILCFDQSKLRRNSKTWKKAIESLTPEFFYMAMVGIILCNPCLYPYLDVHRKRENRFHTRQCRTRIFQMIWR